MSELSEMAALVKLARFGGKILRYSRGEAAGCDIDGGDVQDWALELGVLETRVVTEPCGDECVCAEWSDFPQECYFENPAVSRWLSTPEQPATEKP